MTRGLRAAIAILAVAAVAGCVWYVVSRLPRIDSAAPPAVSAGEAIRITGRNFGASRGDSEVLLGGIPPTAGSYLAWSDTEIRLKMPLSVDSGLLRVRTGHGDSNPALFMNSSMLPVPAKGAGSGYAGPRILSTSPGEVGIGSLLVIEGVGFGPDPAHGTVRFSWQAPEPLPAGTPSRGAGEGLDLDPAYIEPSGQDLAYVQWDDKKIAVRVPDGAVSGSVRVHTLTADSNAAFVRVKPGPGVKRLVDPTVYSVRQEVDLEVEDTTGYGRLTLWLPNPSDFAAQRILGEPGKTPSPLIQDYQGTSVYRLADLMPGKEPEIAQTYLLRVYGIETEVDPGKAAQESGELPEPVAACLKPDEIVPSDAPEVRKLAASIGNRERNRQKLAGLAWKWLVGNLRWAPSTARPDPVAALAVKEADSKSIALAACALLRAMGVPSRPVSGVLVRRDGGSIGHFWVEYWISGLGWIPFDPVLGSGANPGGFDAAFADRSRYFGNADNHRIAFSRGLSRIVPLGAGKRSPDKAAWSLQTVFEEGEGLGSWTSTWSEPEILGQY